MTAWSNETWAGLARHVGARAGLAVERDAEHAEIVFARAARDAGLSDDAFVARAANNPEALDALVDTLTVGETYFFRNPGSFEFLRREVIPDILARRGATHPLRIWSAGCASGEEAWSLAMIFARDGLENARVHATDVSRPALEKARRGIYGPWSLRGGGAALAKSRLEREGNTWRVPEDLRRRVEFDRQNLALDALPSPARGLWGFDVIFCRNVLLYFYPAMVAQVFRKLHSCLADGGWLFLGTSDPSPAGFEAVVRDEGVFYRRAEAPSVETTVAASARRPRRKSRVPAPAVRVSKRPAPPAPALPTQRPPLTPSTDRLSEIRQLANTDERAAERRCAALRTREPDSIEVAYLHAVLLLALGRVDDAVRAARQVLYLDRSLAAGHFLLATAFLRRGDVSEARRAFATSAKLAGALAPDDTVPLADGETAGRFRNAAASQLELLDATEER